MYQIDGCMYIVSNTYSDIYTVFKTLVIRAIHVNC